MNSIPDKKFENELQLNNILSVFIKKNQRFVFFLYFHDIVTVKDIWSSGNLSTETIKTKIHWKKIIKIYVFFIVNISWKWEKRHRSNIILSINYKFKINSFIWRNDHLAIEKKGYQNNFFDIRYLVNFFFFILSWNN